MNPTNVIAPSIVLPWQEALWGFLTLSIFISWWSFYFKFYSEDLSFAERVLAAFVSMVSQIVVSTILLGFFHIVGWYELGILNAFISVVITVISTGHKEGIGFSNELINLFELTGKLLGSSIGLLIIAIMGLAVVVWYGYLGQLLPPMAWDAWSYHLPWAALARQERFLGPFDYPVRWLNVYPMNTDILFLWTVVGCGTDRWANITQLPFGLMAVLACYLLARRVGSDRKDAAITGFLVLGIPVIMHQMWTAYVDLSVMSSMFIALAFLTRKKLTGVALAIAGCASGFLAGSKGTGLYYCFSLFLLFIFRLIPTSINGISETGKAKVGEYFKAIAIFAVTTFLLGSYFYLRNWILTGNPTGIFTVKIAGLTLFKGSVDANDYLFGRLILGDFLYDKLRTKANLIIVAGSFFDPQDWFSQDNRVGGWGAVWACLFFPSIPFALYWGIVKKNLIAIGIIVSGLLTFFILDKMSHTLIRYHMTIIAAGAASFAYVLTVPAVYRLRRLFILLAIFFMALTIVVASPRQPFTLSTKEIAEARKVPYPENDRYSFFDSWDDPKFTDALLSVEGDGTTLAISGNFPNSKTLAAWNPRFSNRVVWAEWKESGEEWEKFLSDNNANAVYIPSGNEELDWAFKHKKKFKLIAQDDKVGSIFIFKSGKQMK